MTEQLDRIEDTQLEILAGLASLIGQMTTLIELITSGEVKPPLPVGGSLFGRTETRWVYISRGRNLKIPVVKDGEFVYSPNLAYTLPPLGQRTKSVAGTTVEVYRPHIQGNGTRLYELVSKPGNFLMNMDIKRL